MVTLIRVSGARSRRTAAVAAGATEDVAAVSCNHRYAV